MTMTKRELETLNFELIEILMMLRDQIDAKLDELAAADEDPDDADEEDDED
jgi:hypothetical protein